jgi:hypothetical protein
MTDALVPLFECMFRSLVYFTALKIRKLEPRGMTSIMCGGAPFLAGLIPMPPMIHLAITFAVAGYFISHNCDAEIYPETMGIVFTVEVVSAFAFGYGVAPLIEMIS